MEAEICIYFREGHDHLQEWEGLNFSNYLPLKGRCNNLQNNQYSYKNTIQLHEYALVDDATNQAGTSWQLQSKGAAGADTTLPRHLVHMQARSVEQKHKWCDAIRQAQLVLLLHHAGYARHAGM